MHRVVIRLLACWSTLALALLLATCTSATPQPVVMIVTVVVTATSGPTATPLVVTEVQTVVVTATPERSATPQSSPTQRRGETPSPTATATATPAVAETATPRPAPTRTTRVYPAPTLIAPANTESFDAGGTPVLRWQGVGTLAPDEYYEVTIERIWQNAPYYAGSDWTKESEYIVPKAIVLNTSDSDQYTWWVTIKRLTGTDASGNKKGEALSLPSESRTFTWK